MNLGDRVTINPIGGGRAYEAYIVQLVPYPKVQRIMGGGVLSVLEEEIVVVEGEPSQIALAAERERKRQAEDICAALNARLGWLGANPEYVSPAAVGGRGGGYTGGITLSQRAGEELAKQLMKEDV